MNTTLRFRGNAIAAVRMLLGQTSLRYLSGDATSDCPPGTVATP